MIPRMQNEEPEYNHIPFVRELCKHKSEEEIREAEENFRDYLLLVKRICERIEREEKEKLFIDDNKSDTV
jgi:hypothetical protein